MFQLAFHIPYYVWRMSDKAREDHRLNANAGRLRQSRDVSFLNWESSGSSYFLYEAQISCLVAGSDESRWVAYGFVDTYFDAAGDGKETVEGYHEDMDGGMHADPLTYGVIDAEKAISTPREYFLSVFRIRIAQVKREWEQVVVKVQQSIREYLHVSCLFFGFHGGRLEQYEPIRNFSRRSGRRYVEEAVFGNGTALLVSEICLISCVASHLLTY
jgi:hypothetical protein